MVNRLDLLGYFTVQSNIMVIAVVALFYGRRSVKFDATMPDF